MQNISASGTPGFAPPAAGPETATPPRFRVWADKPEQFTTFKRQSIHHNFNQHPLMQLGALSALAHRLLPTKQCRFIAPGATQTSVFSHQDNDARGFSLDEVFQRIEEPGSWIALYNVETDPAYKGFLDEVMASVGPLIEREQPGVFNLGGFIFISAPPSVTPFHIDRENNFWLQMRGQKVMTVWDDTDRQVVSAADRERFIVYDALQNVRLQEGHAERGLDFRVGPGDGVYFPSTSPHATRCEPGWAQPGDGYSISIGVVFYTSVTRQRAYIHAFNHFLRNRGLHPREPGESAWADALKHLGGRAWVAAQERFGGYKRTVSF